MFSTKSIVVSESSIPSYWVFQYYLNLSEKLTGQDLKIKSIFNPNEKTPSMCLFVDKSIMQYKFKDFSTGNYGSKIDLIRMIFNSNYNDAVERMITDYNEYVKNDNDLDDFEFKIQNKWKVDFAKTRNWNADDQYFWLSFRIGMTMLNKYNVKPLEYYNMVKEDDNTLLKIENSLMYGYYTKDGELYKIYQPRKPKYKFNKIFSYLQGIDQLQYDKPYLVICSSLKDAMTLAGFGYNVETIAPDSENTIIKPHVIENLKQKYKKVITLFDNDDAGKKAIEKYKEVYNINGTSLSLSKDISDAVKQYGFEKVHEELKPLLKQEIHKI